MGVKASLFTAATVILWPVRGGWTKGTELEQRHLFASCKAVAGPIGYGVRCIPNRHGVQMHPSAHPIGKVIPGHSRSSTQAGAASGRITVSRIPDGSATGYHELCPRSDHPREEISLACASRGVALPTNRGPPGVDETSRPSPISHRQCGPNELYHLVAGVFVHRSPFFPGRYLRERRLLLRREGRSLAVRCPGLQRRR